MSAMITGLWNPHAGQEALHLAYLSGFKDGLLLAVAIFSILLVLFRRD